MTEQETHHAARWVPEPFAPADPIAQHLCNTLVDRLDGNDEVTRIPVVDEIACGQLWSRASGGWQVQFECDIQNSLGQGRLPSCLSHRVEQLQLEAFLSWVDDSRPELIEELDAIRYPRNLPSLYEYAAHYLGKTKLDVDADISKQVWALYGSLTDKEREEVHESEREWINGSYVYGLEIAYLRPTDLGNVHTEPVIEIAATFRADELSTQHDIAKLTILPEALTEGFCEMLADWALARFMEQ